MRFFVATGKNDAGPVICPQAGRPKGEQRKDSNEGVAVLTNFHLFFTMGGLYRLGTNEGAMNEPFDQTVKILLAEDDNDMRRFLVKALENAGYSVISFDNGLEAYNRLREEPFELLLTDIVMPEMDGIELARRATELDPDIKVMFITGFAAVALNPDNQAPRQAKILSKPFHLKDLVNEVTRLLAA
jgi:two-component system cell cycle response regulator CpdR